MGILDIQRSELSRKNRIALFEDGRKQREQAQDELLKKFGGLER